MKLQELYKEIREAERWWLILVVFFKPMIPLELIALTGFKKNYITFILKKFLEKGIMYCLFPDNITGRIYTLTDLGIRLRKMIIDDLDEKGWKEFLDKGVTYEFRIFPSSLNLDLYRHVVSGKDRREFIILMRKVMVEEKKNCFTAMDIFLFYNTEENKIDITKDKQTPSTEIYRVAWDFVKLGILAPLRIGKRGVAFKFTEQGSIIAEQFQYKHFRLTL